MEVDASRSRTVDLLSKIAIVVAVIGALAVAAVMLREPHRAITDDSVEYLGLARNLVREHRYSSHYHPGQPELYRTPIYPLFLASLGAWKSLAGLRLAMIVQLALGFCAAWSIGHAARSFGSKRPWMIGALYLTSPVVLVNTLSIGTEGLFVPLAAAGAWLLVRGLRRASPASMLGSGIAIGLATLARPIGIVLCVGGLLAATACVRRPRARGLAVAWVLGAWTLLGAWSIRNGVEAQFWGPSRTLVSFPSSIFGSDYLEHGIEPMKTSAYDEEGFGAGMKDMASAVVRHPWRAVREVVIGSGRTLLGPGEWALRRALLGDPGFREPSGKASIYDLESAAGELRLVPREVQIESRARSAACWAILGWSVLSMLAVYALALGGFLSWVRRPHLLGAIWILSAIGLTLASAGYLGNSRFRLPVLPFILLIAACRGVDSAQLYKRLTRPHDLR